MSEEHAVVKTDTQVEVRRREFCEKLLEDLYTIRDYTDHVVVYLLPGQKAPTQTAVAHGYLLRYAEGCAEESEFATKLKFEPMVTAMRMTMRQYEAENGDDK